MGPGGGGGEIIVSAPRLTPPTETSDSDPEVVTPPVSEPPRVFAAAAPRKKARDFCGSNGSGAVPDHVGGTDITGPCAVHDDCYGSSTPRQQCDQQILNMIWQECRQQSNSTACYVAGLVYYYGLRIFGGPAYRRGKE